MLIGNDLSKKKRKRTLSNSHIMLCRIFFSAPEVYFGEQYTPKADIYSLGIILWELVTRLLTGTYERPYSEYSYV
jgi:serine/threonine protein kinase